MVIAISILGFKSNEIGSEVIATPGLIVIIGLLLKDNFLIVDVSIALPPFEAAICTALMVTGLVPNSFENLTRRQSAPRETRTTCRNVLLLNPGGGGLLFGSTSCGAALQVPTHTVVESALANAKRVNVQSNRRMSGVAEDE
jgi:hypothetical protein